MVASVIRSPRTILALLTSLNLLNYLDRFVLPAVLKGVKEELALSGALAGSLATVFLIGYFATSPIFGALADRAGPKGNPLAHPARPKGRGRRKHLIALGIAVWSAATFASGLVHQAGTLLVARALVGVGEASYATIAPSIIDDIAPPERKGRWLAIFFAAIPVGSALGYVLGGQVLAVTHSWRSAFFVAGGPGIVLALVCLLIAEPAPDPLPPPPPGEGGQVDGSAAAAKGQPDALALAQTLARMPLYRGAVLGYCAYTFALGGFAYWAPYYISERYGLPPESASRTFGILTVAGGAVGTLLGGWLGDRAARGKTDDPSVARAAVAVCSFSAALGAPLAAAAILATTATGFYAVAFPCEVALFLHFGPFNVAILRSVPPGLRNTAMAMSIFASHLLGDLWSPWLIGLAGDHAPMTYAMLLVPVAFGASALLWWLWRAAPARAQ
jgi:MFS family permease